MQWQPTPVLLPGKSQGRRSLVGCSPWSRKESDMTEQLHFHFSLSCIGEGNGNPLQYFCLENPRDGGAWQAAVCGVTRSRTRLKRLTINDLIRFRVILVLLKFVKIASQVVMFISNIGIKCLVLILSNHQLELLIHYGLQHGNILSLLLYSLAKTLL